MRRFLLVLFSAAALAYPVLVFCFLVIFKIPLRLLSLFVIFAALGYFLLNSSQKKKKKPVPLFLSTGLLLLLGLLCLITDAAVVLKFYPVLISGGLLFFFAGTLFFPPVMIFRFAVLQDKSIKGSLAESRIAAYCRKVTIVWCCFFILNGGIALFTVFSSSDVLWSIYNGGISYILMGLLFAGEFVIRKMKDKKMPRAIPLSNFTPSSRSPDTVLCYEDTWETGIYHTWGDFLEDTARLRKIIQKNSSQKWLLHCEDYWYFLSAFTALLQCKKQVLLTANISPAYIAEIRDSNTAFLTDHQLMENTLHIPSLLGDETGPVDTEAPPVNADETVIVLYTSGTTGRPKAVVQRLTEFEIDNRFILSKWGDEWLSRKVCSTVSQHHIYGLLFSILLPFTAGVPFRRTRIEFPEEFEKLTGEPLMIITVPAFLKRAVEEPAGKTPGLNSLDLKAPWIFTSGGVLLPETAEKTNEAFGFWPLEVYGSTETSGIAWRQSRDGLQWTPFDNAEISKNEDGCLVIRSPYIKDPAGFITGDLVDILDDGRFFLRGRADSIVKIEEKRISLPEVENRILQSGLISDVCVVALEEKRQYLAAALVLNEAGKTQFKNAEKFEINRYFSNYLQQFFENVVLPKKWRYVQSLPVDVQGKKKKLEIEELFSMKNIHSVTAKVLEKKESSVKLELFIPGESDYFDGHFPEFKLLPAVAQIDLTLRFASVHFGTPLWAAKIKRIKFSNIIRPDSPVLLEIEEQSRGSSLGFKMTSLQEETVYSSGTLVPGNPS
ncbi:hypothetical protein FACS189447_04150 [Spirochaetia bacterium]|nr:hypothetical protein FACS189447_04150 [Spirochaetia bacterium]